MSAPSSEYIEEFDTLRRNRMAMSYYKYGPIAVNFGEKLCKATPQIHARLKLYEETGNTEWLVDIANMCMIEWKYPQHPQAHFRATSSEEAPKPVGMPINQMKTHCESIGQGSGLGNREIY